MNINIVCVGNIKEKFIEQAIQEYKQRISKFANVNIVEVKEEKLTKNYSLKDVEICVEKESEKILNQLKGYSVLIDIDGKMLSSVELAKKMENILLTNSTINFIIGGSYGVSEKLKNSVDFRLSFSKLTFPHQLFRVNVLEQIYRAFTIINNITYHK